MKKPSKAQLTKAVTLTRQSHYLASHPGFATVRDESRMHTRSQRAIDSCSKTAGFDCYDQIMRRANDLGPLSVIPGKDL